VQNCTKQLLVYLCVCSQPIRKPLGAWGLIIIIIIITGGQRYTIRALHAHIDTASAGGLLGRPWPRQLLLGQSACC
jgi:hypothetical protein